MLSHATGEMVWISNVDVFPKRRRLACRALLSFMAQSFCQVSIGLARPYDGTTIQQLVLVDAVSRGDRNIVTIMWSATWSRKKADFTGLLWDTNVNPKGQQGWQFPS